MQNAATDKAADAAYLSGLVVIALHLAYAIATVGGFLSLEGSEKPISDPWFAVMEVLIIALAPPVLIFFAALAHLEQVHRLWMVAAGILAAIALTPSAVLHAVLIVIGRGHPLAADGALLAFTWPSAAYAVDILAWDWFFACSLLCCAMGLRASPALIWARRTFLLAGLLALAGLAGPLTGSMALRNIGILGYAVLFPLAVCQVLLALRRAKDFWRA